MNFFLKKGTCFIKCVTCNSGYFLPTFAYHTVHTLHYSGSVLKKVCVACPTVSVLNEFRRTFSYVTPDNTKF